MMTGTVATTKTRTRPAKPVASRRPTLTEIGREAQRAALLAELKAQAWNLTAVAKELGLTNASNVVRAIRTLGLVDEYDAAKERGDIVPGRHPS